MIIANSALKNVLDYFEVTATCSGSIVVKVLDVHGRVAKTMKQTLEESIDKIRLNVEDLSKGNYIINIFTEDSFIKAVRYTKK